MKPLPVLTVLLLASLVLTSVFMNSCGDDAPPADPDARPISDAQIDDAGEELLCPPVSGTDLALQEVVRGLTDPLFLTAPEGDQDRLFVLEQPGTIRLVIDNELVPTPFLDIQDLVRDVGNEQGLLGMAFHPDYANNGRFFVNYTAQSPSGDTVVAEYTVSADPNLANTAGTILMTITQPFANHNGGMLTFGPDGYLYVATGDGGFRDDPDGNGQNLNTHLGKLLRIDVDTGSPYGIPSDNPFAGGGGLPEIWAYGLRNPWRLSFDSLTGDLYIADVGQGRREEISVQPAAAAGVNYGWKITEGTECFQAASCNTSGLVGPVHDYPHTEGRESITGGYVYRGPCLPDIQGWYFFGDFASGQVYKFEGGEAATDLQELTGTLDPNGDINGLTSFGVDGIGELYIISRNGKVFRIIARQP